VIVGLGGRTRGEILAEARKNNSAILSGLGRMTAVQSSRFSHLLGATCPAADNAVNLCFQPSHLFPEG
jgi:hypothetical protein